MVGLKRSCIWLRSKRWASRWSNLCATTTTTSATPSACWQLAEFGIKNVVFSSSATVYGEPPSLPLSESMPTGRATNPYGWTKIMMEQVMIDLAFSDPEWSVTLLRYFNPVGAHSSGEIGEDPIQPSHQLDAVVCEVAAEQTRLGVFGTDYPTSDGSAVRDYVHVMDVAEGHVAAVERISGRSGRPHLQSRNRSGDNSPRASSTTSPPPIRSPFRGKANLVDRATSLRPGHPSRRRRRSWVGCAPRPERDES